MQNGVLISQHGRLQSFIEKNESLQVEVSQSSLIGKSQNCIQFKSWGMLRQNTEYTLYHCQDMETIKQKKVHRLRAEGNCLSREGQGAWCRHCSRQIYFPSVRKLWGFSLPVNFGIHFKIQFSTESCCLGHHVAFPLRYLRNISESHPGSYPQTLKPRVSMYSHKEPQIHLKSWFGLTENTGMA